MTSFHFKGKSFLQNYHHTVKFHKLKATKKGVGQTCALDDNLLIQGDNLKALKALLPTHAGKVKCIYIDPPYNTGKENWVYNDNVASPMIQEWLGKVVSEDDLTRHDKWCCMMYPRLVLLRELLSEDGMIFVSIDDNEAHRLQSMMEEIFGEENCIARIIWQKKYTQSNDAKFFSATHDHILCFGKNKELVKINPLSRTEEQNKRYTNPDNDARGGWKATPLHAKSGSTSTETIFPNGVKWSPPKGTYNRYAKQTILDAYKDDRIYFGKDGKGTPVMKKFLAEMSNGVIPKSIWLHSEVGNNDSARRELKEIFYPENPFDTPKPSTLVQRIIALSTSPDDIILDSFAGSGTTAHAVLALNKEDGGNRKFILVECEDYADEITGERVRRVIEGVPNAKDKALHKGLGGTFSYYELGEELEMDKILEGKDLPNYEELAKYAFFTSTGESWDQNNSKRDTYHIGSSSTFEVFLLYEQDKEKLKQLALNLDFATEIHKQFPTKQKLVFAPACFMEEHHLKEYGIRFAQLPFEIYRMAE